MPGCIVAFLVGVVCVVLGCVNMTGNISTLHSYHTHRVSEADKLPFGRKMGLGTILVGGGIMAFSVLSSVTLYTENNAYLIVGTAVMVLAMLVGLGICLYALFKYNKGIF